MPYTHLWCGYVDYCKEHWKATVCFWKKFKKNLAQWENRTPGGYIKQQAERDTQGAQWGESHEVSHITLGRSCQEDGG